jgi:AraC-like DNA-binding protein
VLRPASTPGAPVPATPAGAPRPDSGRQPHSGAVGDVLKCLVEVLRPERLADDASRDGVWNVSVSAGPSQRPVLGWLDRFHAVLETVVADGPPGLDQVAHRLAMSPRTLQRRLREEGTSWRQELERLRHSRVDRLLWESSLSVEAIAARVGFTDSRALRRAIHRWYGHGPAAIRASGPTWSHQP